VPKIITDRRAVTSLEYALIAGALALVLVEVLQVPMQLVGDLVSHAVASLNGSGASTH
jgi:Flp pilus assembly pilin Flp